MVGAQVWWAGWLAAATSHTGVLAVAHAVTTDTGLTGKLFPVDNHVGRVNWGESRRIRYVRKC